MSKRLGGITGCKYYCGQKRRATNKDPNRDKMLCDSTSNGTDQYQNGSSNLLTPYYREQPRSTRIAIAYPRPAFSATNWTNYAPTSFDQQIHRFSVCDSNSWIGVNPRVVVAPFARRHLWCVCAAVSVGSQCVVARFARRHLWGICAVVSVGSQCVVARFARRHL